MKVLFVLGGKVGRLHKADDKEGFSYYIREQAENLTQKGVQVEFFRFQLRGKLDAFYKIHLLRRQIKSGKYDLIHAHYGLFGFLSLFAKSNTPLITTLHGTDINNVRNNYLSSLAVKFSDYSIFVSEDLLTKAKYLPNRIKCAVIPCGVDRDVFYPIPKEIAREKLGMKKDGVCILFGSSSENPIKNFALAKRAVELLNFPYEMRELTKLTREQVNLIMNASNLLLMTSISEGSPQVIKEALFTNLPIVSVDVGDVKENIKNLKNCHIAERDPSDIARKISLIVENGCGRTNGSEIAGDFDNAVIADRIYSIYSFLVNRDK